MTTAAHPAGAPSAPVSPPAPPVWTRPDVYTDLRGALVRGSRNYHRLEHLGRPGSYTLLEETVTDLLIAEMVGKGYTVAARCPVCAADSSCADWTGVGPLVGARLHVRTLTKYEEGGHKRRRILAANADFVIAFGAYDPDNKAQATNARQVRLLVQAKRAMPGKKFLTTKRERKQYHDLVNNAPRYGAAPYYALYVQQPHGHASSATACSYHLDASDRAIVLVPAGNPASGTYLVGRPVDDVIASGRPLRCLAGCNCSGATAATSSVSEAGGAFVRRDFPDYSPALLADPLPANTPSVEMNASQYKPAGDDAITGNHRSSKRTTQPGTKTPGSTLIVRLARQQRSNDSVRRWTGFDPGMSAQDLKDAARMYWRLDPRRAERLQYVVAAHGGVALEVYAIRPDGAFYTVSSDGKRRTGFEVDVVTDEGLRATLLHRSDVALSQLERGAANPVHYLD